MKNLKKALALILCLAMTLTMLPMNLVSAVSVEEPVNLIQNPGFEIKSLNGWSAFKYGFYQYDTEKVYDGEYSLKITPDTATNKVSHINQTVSGIEAGKAYKFSVQYMAEGGQLPNVYIDWLDASGTVIGSRITLPAGASSDSEWIEISSSFVAPEGAVSMYFQFDNRLDVSMWVDNFSLVETDNLVSNPGFECGIALWTLAKGSYARDNAHVFDGYSSLKVTSSASAQYASVTQLVPVEAGKTYDIGMYFITETAATPFLIFEWHDASGAIIGSRFTQNATTNSTTDWTKISTTLTAPAGAEELYFSFDNRRLTSMWIDGCYVIESDNLLNNAGFETAWQGWTFGKYGTYLSDTTYKAVEGTSARITTDANKLAYIRQTVPVEAGKVYEVGALVKTNAAGAKTFINFLYLDEAGVSVGSHSVYAPAEIIDWTPISMITRAPAGAVNVLVEFDNRNDSGTIVWYDGTYLVESDELISNGGFESGTYDWTLFKYGTHLSDKTAGNNSTAALKMFPDTASSAVSNVKQWVPVEAGATYSFSVDYLGNSASPFAYLQWTDDAQTANFGTLTLNVAATESWTQIAKADLVAPEGATKLLVQLDNRDANATPVYFDNASLKKVADAPEIEVHVHELTYVESVAATCTEAGVEAYYTCECGLLFADADATVEIEAPAAIDATGHADEDIDGVCDNCEEVLAVYVAVVNGEGYESLDEALAAFAAGGTLTLKADATISAPITITADSEINGAGYTLTYTGSDRAIDVVKTNVSDLAISDLTVVANKAQRGINYNTNGSLTLDGVTVVGGTYAVNLPGSSDGAIVNITDSDLSGCIALNIWGENATINVTDTAMTCSVESEVENYTAVKLNNDTVTSAEGTVVTITGGSITATGDNKTYGNDTATGVINISESTVVNGEASSSVAIINYGENSYTFATLEDAFEKANDGETIVMLGNYEIPATIYVSKDVTLDLNGKQLIAPDTGASNGWYGFIVNGGNFTFKDSVGGGEMWCKCFGVETKSGSFTMESGSIVATNNKTLGAAVVNYGGTVTILGGSLAGADNAVHTGGYFADANTTIAADVVITEGYVGLVDWGTGYTQTVTSANGTYAPIEGYEWVDNGDGTYTLSEIVETPEIPEPTFSIAATNVSMGNNLDIQFAIPQSAVADWSGYYAVLTKEYADGRANRVDTVPYEAWTTNGNYYVVTATGIAAKEMADDISVVIYDANGYAASFEFVQSMRNYAMTGISKATTDLQKRLFVDMLNYGAAAQVNFGYGTDDLATALLTPEQAAYGTNENPALENKYARGTYHGASNLKLESNILFQIALKNIADGMYATIEYTGHTGRLYTKTYNDSNFGVMGSYKICDIDTMVIADARQPITITVYNADGSVAGVSYESIENYCAFAGASGLPIELISYADSAYAYLHRND